MAVYEIPLTADNQTFSIDLGNASYKMTVNWREPYWIVDLMDAGGNMLIAGIPLVTGANLLAQYEHLNLSFKLFVICDISTQEYPTKTDLGSGSHLFVTSE